MPRFLLAMPPEYFEGVDAIAERDGKTRTQVIRDAVLAYLKEDRRREAANQ